MNTGSGEANMKHAIETQTTVGPGGAGRGGGRRGGLRTFCVV